MKLKFKKDFWSFYNENKKEVDTIIASFVFKYQIPMPAQEVIHEVLILLHKNGFLSRFNSNNARLNTYLTSIIRGYVLHIIRENTKQSKIFSKQIPVKGWNSDKGSYDNFVEITDQESLENSLEASDLDKNIRSKLKKSDYKIYDLYTSGYNKRQIGKKFSITPTWVKNRVDFIQSKISRLFKTENIYVS